MLAFAGNSVLCRLALADNTIDAATFTAARLLAGMTVLGTLLAIRQRTAIRPSAAAEQVPTVKNTLAAGSWSAALMLFVYALSFSFAYVSLDTATGALILFGAVQITMVIAGLRSASRLSLLEWAGLAIAFGGFVYMVLPGVDMPAPFGLGLMTCAGVAWGIYSLLGRGSKAPLADTATNFLRTLPFTLFVLIFAIDQGYWSQEGLILAIVSGGVTSGLGYAIWYRALAGLTTTQAAVVQLLVPVFAAIGGILFADELLTTRLMFAALLVLGGILMVVIGQRAAHKGHNSSS
jgi:drug/metabolite transporter (DMT)-like permease